MRPIGLQVTLDSTTHSIAAVKQATGGREGDGGACWETGSRAPMQRQPPLTCTAPPPHAVPLVLSLSKRRRLDPFLRNAALATLLQHVLFVRGVVPVASADLLRMAAEEARDDHEHQGDVSSSSHRRRRRRVRSRSHLKMVQVGRDLGQLLSDVQSMFGCSCSTGTNSGDGASTGTDDTDNGNCKDRDSGGEGGTAAAAHPQSGLGWNIKAALVTLGPSLRSPREQYLIRFHSPLPPSLEGMMQPPPPEMHARLENELSRRIVREYLRGTLDPAHAATFTARGGGVGGGSACRRAHVALCIGKVGVGGKGQGGVTDEDGSGGSRNPTCELSPELCKRIVVQRNFALKVPTMISKKRGLHRPFVVFDLEASGVATGSVSVNDAASFFGPEDEWIALRSKIKGFRSLR